MQTYIYLLYMYLKCSKIISHYFITSLIVLVVAAQALAPPSAAPAAAREPAALGAAPGAVPGAQVQGESPGCRNLRFR